MVTQHQPLPVSIPFFIQGGETPGPYYFIKLFFIDIPYRKLPFFFVSYENYNVLVRSSKVEN